MEILCDPAKNEKNYVKHGVFFEEIKSFQWQSAMIFKDERKDYGEKRRTALGLIGQRLHVFIYTIREGKIRAISLRKANKRERRKYEEAI